jgi:hypothetical protein
MVISVSSSLEWGDTVISFRTAGMQDNNMTPLCNRPTMRRIDFNPLLTFLFDADHPMQEKA